jgi:hypothetical protein
MPEEPDSDLEDRNRDWVNEPDYHDESIEVPYP